MFRADFIEVRNHFAFVNRNLVQLSCSCWLVAVWLTGLGGVSVSYGAEPSPASNRVTWYYQPNQGGADRQPAVF